MARAKIGSHIYKNRNTKSNKTHLFERGDRFFTDAPDMLYLQSSIILIRKELNNLSEFMYNYTYSFRFAMQHISKLYICETMDTDEKIHLEVFGADKVWRDILNCTCNESL